MDIHSALGQLRPILSLVGSAFFVVGIAKFFGVAGIPTDLTTLAIVGFAFKNI